MFDFKTWNATAKLDLLLGGGLVILFLTMFFWIIPTQIPAIVAHPLAHALAPSFLPSIMSLIIVVLGFFIAVHAWRTAVTSVEARSNEVTESTAGDWRRTAVIRTVSALVLSFAYYVFFDAIGALLSAVLITVFLILLSGERRWRIVAIAGIFVPTLIYLVFTQIAAAPLPRGILTFY